jgi:hypothetical protein
MPLHTIDLRHRLEQRAAPDAQRVSELVGARHHELERRLLLKLLADLLLLILLTLLIMPAPTPAVVVSPAATATPTTTTATTVVVEENASPKPSQHWCPFKA